MKFSDDSGKKALQKRLNRIEGQVRGISAMIADERDCREILQQLSAARSALQSVTLQLAEQAINDCLLSGEANKETTSTTARDLVDMISRI